MTKYSSKTEMLIQGIYIGGKAWQIEADKSCNDSKTLQDYMRHEQQSHSYNTHAETASIHLMILKNRSSLFRVHKTQQDICTNVHALHCDNLDRIQSCLDACPLF